MIEFITRLVHLTVGNVGVAVHKWPASRNVMYIQLPVMV